MTRPSVICVHRLASANFVEGVGLGWGALASHPYPVYEFSIWTLTLIDASHRSISFEMGDTAEGAGGPKGSSLRADEPMQGSNHLISLTV